MSPRCVEAGSTYLITRRTLRRYKLFRPDEEVGALVIYTLAICALRFGIKVHAVCVMSTHIHLVITDVHGVLPKFLQHFHRLVALATKVLRKWDGPVWDYEQTSTVKLLSDEAIIRAIAYTMANPVEAGLVNHASDWPGVVTRIEALGDGAASAARPEVFFNPLNPQWPPSATLTFEPPPRTHDVERFRASVGDTLSELEREARAKFTGRGWRVLGRERALRVSPYERATSLEPLRARNPTFATGRLGRAAFRAGVQALRAFRSAYREALDRWRAGNRSVVFPAGTWWMHVFHGAPTSELARAA